MPQLRYSHGSGGPARQTIYQSQPSNSLDMTEEVNTRASSTVGQKVRLNTTRPTSVPSLSKLSVDGNKVDIKDRYDNELEAQRLCESKELPTENDNDSTHSSLHCDFESIATHAQNKGVAEQNTQKKSMELLNEKIQPSEQPDISRINKEKLMKIEMGEKKETKIQPNNKLQIPTNNGRKPISPTLTTGLKLLDLQERDKGTGIKKWLQEAKSYEKQYKSSADARSLTRASSAASLSSAKSRQRSASSPAQATGQLRKSQTEPQLSKLTRRKNPREAPKYMPSYSMTPAPGSLGGTNIKLSGYFHHQMPRHKRGRTKSEPPKPKPVKPSKPVYQKPSADPKRPRPWAEKTPPISDNTDTHIEIHYDSYLPKGKWLEYKPKSFTYNHKHGDCYESRVRSECDSDSDVEESFVWENQYQIWLFEKNGKKGTVEPGGGRRVQSARESTRQGNETITVYNDTSSYSDKTISKVDYANAKWRERPKSAVPLSHNDLLSRENQSAVYTAVTGPKPPSVPKEGSSPRNNFPSRPLSAKSVAWADQQDVAPVSSLNGSQISITDARNIITQDGGKSGKSLEKQDRLVSSSDGVARFLHLEETPVSENGDNESIITTPASDTINTFCLKRSVPYQKNNHSKTCVTDHKAGATYNCLKNTEDASSLSIQGKACERASKVCVVRPHTASGSQLGATNNHVSRPQSAPPIKSALTKNNNSTSTISCSVQTDNDCVQECLKTLENIQQSLKAYANTANEYQDDASQVTQSVGDQSETSSMFDEPRPPVKQTKTVDVSVKEVNGEIIKTVTTGEEPVRKPTSSDYVVGKGESIIYTDTNGHIQAQVSSLTFPDGERRINSENTISAVGRKRPQSASIAEGGGALSREMRKMYRRRASRPASAASSTSSKKGKQPAMSNQDLFEKFNWMRIEKIRRRKAATCIQRHVRGWLIRRAFKNMIKKSFEEHHKTWWKFVEEYKALIGRIQKRYGAKRPSTPFSIKDVKEYMHKKHEYEQVFDDLSRGTGKLAKEKLPEFFRKCSLYPLQREIEESFRAVFDGCGTRAEVIFMLDCSASVGEFNFRSMMAFVKDMVRHFELSDNAVRIGIIPYNDDVFNVIGIESYDSREMLFSEIDAIKYKGGLTRTDSAIHEMRQMLSSARPNCPLVGIVITDGQSYHTNKTKHEASLAKQEGVQLFAVGVGQNIDKQELVAIATDKVHVHTVYSYHALHKVKNAVTAQTCLTNCGLCHFKDPSECSERCRGLYKSEVLEILWMIYCPKATGLTKYRKSTWMNPMLGEEDAMRYTESKPIDDPSFKTCMELVVKSKLDREGAVDVPHPSDPHKVTTVTDYNQAMDFIEEYIKAKKEAEEDAAELRAAFRKSPNKSRITRKAKQINKKGENYFNDTESSVQRQTDSEQFKTVI